MKPTFHTTLSISLAILAALPVGAQTVSLDSCRNMALRTNKALLSADQAIAAAGYGRKAAKAAYLPGIDFSATYMYNQHKTSILSEDAKLPTMQFDPATGKYNYNILTDAQGVPVQNPDGGGYIPTTVAVIPKSAMEFDTRSVFAGAVTLTQPVFMGGQIRALNDIARYGEAALEAGKNSARLDVIYNVDEMYWTVVSLRSKQRLAQSFVNLVDTLYYNVNAMLEEGVATRSDLLTVQVKCNEAKMTLSKVDNGLSLARMALAQQCGLPIDTKMKLADEDAPTSAVPSGDFGYRIEDVYARRQDLEAVRQGIHLMESKEKLEFGAMLPKVGIVGAYTFSTPNFIDGYNRNLKGGFSIGAAVTIPIWHWGQNYNRYRAAKAETAAQRILLEDLEDKVNLQVNQARFKYDEAFKTYTTALSNMESAEENLRNAQLGFKEGMLTTNDVITAQTAWLAAHSDIIDAEIGISLCRTYLSKVLGTLDSQLSR